MELVARTVKVRWHEIDRVLAILGSVGLNLNKLSEFGNSVGCVGFFGIPLPKRCLCKGNRREFRVRTDGADHHGFWCVLETGFVEHIGAHEEIVEIELGGALHVGSDAPNARRKMNNEIGLRVGEHFGDGQAVA